MAIAENTNGSMAPMNNPAITSALEISMLFNWAAIMNAPKRARAVRAAEAMAKPFPMAAVVLPTESSLSVIFLTSFGSPDISAIPPELSAIGP